MTPESPSGYVGRLAPSPTGLLHLGHAATFWAAAQRAKSAQGTLLLRIEDLDQQRARPEFTAAISEDLRWLGIAWSEPVTYQSQRIAAYRSSFAELLRAGYLYPCHCSRKDLAAMLAAPHEGAQAPLDDEGVYPGTCRSSVDPEAPLQAGMNYRFHVPDDEILTFTDQNLGPQSFTAGVDFGDFLVWRKDGLPSYQLACVVDDQAANVTEVVRGRDLLLSTARQMLLQRALGFATPRYFHTDLLLDEAGVRLAKRHDALALRRLRECGLSRDQVVARFAAEDRPPPDHRSVM